MSISFPQPQPFVIDGDRRERRHNPDVLTCIANLSNDEVFTPPTLANAMLDLLAASWAQANDGADLWADPAVTFLDPFAKSGVFLREITRRLTTGLESTIHDLRERVDHILTKQVFGIGITELTALMTRRSVYCSKYANGKHSIAQSFTTEQGNIWFERTEHTWDKQGKCSFCGASRETLDRGEQRESHAYAFIHTNDIAARLAELFGEAAPMHFDVIIGNPPYQMTGGGGGSNDSAIYHYFVDQAKRLDPRFLSLVIPSRWMAGGRGLNKFRAEFLADKHIRQLIDYENAKEVFPTVGIGGGICYFLWDRESSGACESTYHRNGQIIGPVTRRLDEFDVFVRDSRAVDILGKVVAQTDGTLDGLISGDTPFGLATNFKGYRIDAAPGPNQVLLYANVGTKRVQGAMDRSAITKNTHLIDAWKLFLPVAGSGRERERTGIDLVIGPSIVAEPGAVCTQTYLVCGPVSTRGETESLESYLRTRLVRFLVSLRKPAQHVFRGMYKWVPLQSWDREWTDADLYAMYGLTDEEISLIESTIRPMDLTEASTADVIDDEGEWTDE